MCFFKLFDIQEKDILEIEKRSVLMNAFTNITTSLGELLKRWKDCESQMIREFAMKLCLLVVLVHPHMESHQCKSLNIS